MKKKHLISIASTATLAVTVLLTGCGGDGQSGPAMLSERLVYTSYESGDNQVYMMKPDGTGKKILSTPEDNAFWARPTPDNQWIYYTDGSSICKMKPNGTQKSAVADVNGLSVTYIRFSPDGSKIVFATSGTPDNEIFIMNADGTGMARLTNDAFVDESPVFNTAGDKIMWVSKQSGQFDLWSMNLDGTNKTNLTNTPTGEERFLEANSNSAMFCYLREGVGPDHTVITDFNGSETLAQLGFVRAGFSSDGTKLIYMTSDSEDGDKMFSINVDTTGMTQIGQFPFSKGPITVSGMKAK